VSPRPKTFAHSGQWTRIADRHGKKSEELKTMKRRPTKLLKQQNKPDVLEGATDGNITSGSSGGPSNTSTPAPQARMPISPTKKALVNKRGSKQESRASCIATIASSNASSSRQSTAASRKG
jgi:hypothetical protein